MHTTEIDDAVFNHNGDYSGNVRITDENGNVCEVSFDALKGFVAEYVRQEKISKLENAWYDEVLGL